MMLLQFLDSHRNSYLCHLVTIVFQLGYMFQVMVLCLKTKCWKLFCVTLLMIALTIKKEKVLLNLRCQFTHAPFSCLKNLLKNGEMDTQVDLSSLEKVFSSCKFYYKKTPLRSMFDLFQAHVFSETVAMDLKEWTDGSNRTRFLHMTDHAARYSASSVIKSKRKEVVVDQIFSIWMTILGYPQKIVDNSDELDNTEFR